ncbi:unnamed protein product [Closterium sp. NIES-65]|nr:unnamed protein product [Closterium sp. NIES-65]
MSSGDASSASTKPPKAKHPLSQCMEQQQGGQRVERTYPIHKSPSRRSSILVGSQCMEQQQGGQRVELTYPIHNGVVQRWDDMGHVWDYTFNTALKIDPSESKILLTDPPLNPTKNRQRMVSASWGGSLGLTLQMIFKKYNFDSLFIHLTLPYALPVPLPPLPTASATDAPALPVLPPLRPSRHPPPQLQMMFEKYNFDSLFIQLQAVLPLYAQGILTGLVVDSGESATHAVPVVEGFAYPHLTKRISIAGRQITSHLIDLMMRRGYVWCSLVQTSRCSYLTWILL